MKDFSSFNTPIERNSVKSYSAYNFNGYKNAGNNRKVSVKSEKEQALAAAARIHEEERKKKLEEIEKKKIRPEDLARKAAEAKAKQALESQEMNAYEPVKENTAKDEKPIQSESQIATDEELKQQLEMVKKINQSEKAKAVNPGNSMEDILNAALNDIF